MGNYIKTKNGVDISLSIPAQITSFEMDENENTSSHVTRGKLKVFFIGKTGDIRVFTEAFSKDLITSLPGTPIVAYYDSESEDFLGHNLEQYVYGYVPEDAVPEFIEEDSKTWAVVDVNLFTERKDNIGEVAQKIIGKAQSLELNPDTVDWELVYINNQLTKIVFKKGSFYGLSVLGDNQQAAFDGAGFFTTEVINELRHFHKTSNNDGGNLEMNKTDFLSLGVNDKRDRLDEIIANRGEFDAFYVIDFDEEKVYINACKEVEDWVVRYYAADYHWEEQDQYVIGDFYEVIPSYVKKEENSSYPSSFEKKEEETVDEASEVIEEATEIAPQAENGEGVEVSETTAEETAQPEAEAETPAEVPAEGEVTVAETMENDDEPEERDSDEQQDEQEEKDEDCKKKHDCEEIATNASTLSDEERNELMELRRERKMALVSQYKEFLGADAIAKIEAEIDNYELHELERELKVQSFDANKNKFQEKEDSTFGVVLPNVTQKYTSTLDKLVAENI